eukprot:jgi/Bigna1/86921/estExt_fgenesh1_pg.C_150068
MARIRSEDLSSKSIGELKAVMKAMRISPAGCLEKKDLIDKILKAKEEQKSKPVPINKQYQETVGGLEAYCLQTHEKPELLVFVFHGFGANAENLASIQEALAQKKSGSKKVRFVCLNAPNEMGSGSYAWWPLDLPGLLQKVFTVGVENLFKGNKPNEMGSTVSLVKNVIEAEAKRFSLDLSKVVYCGFSQGSWLATELALTAKECPKALCIFSSALYREEWVEKAKERKGLKVIQTHGRQDFVLPLMQGQMLSKALSNAGCDVDFFEFDGAHTIPMDIKGVVRPDFGCFFWMLRWSVIAHQ